MRTFLSFLLINIALLASSQTIDTSKTTQSINKAINRVLMQYSNLRYRKITFRQASIPVTMQCRPTLWSILFYKRNNRAYCITINNSSKRIGFCVDTLPPDVLIGLLGHEVAHIVDYNSRGFCGIAQRGMNYLCQKSKARFEHQIDSIAISSGFCHQLHLWAKYAHDSPKISPKYKSIKQKTYFSPDEILQKCNEQHKSTQ